MDHLIRWFTILAPLTIVCLWGVVFAVKNLKRARKPAIFVIIGLGILLLIEVLFRPGVDMAWVYAFVLFDR